jgi:hypothetical protein
MGPFICAELYAPHESQDDTHAAVEETRLLFLSLTRKPPNETKQIGVTPVWSASGKPRRALPLATLRGSRAAAYAHTRNPGKKRGCQATGHVTAFFA